MACRNAFHSNSTILPTVRQPIVEKTTFGQTKDYISMKLSNLGPKAPSDEVKISNLEVDKELNKDKYYTEETNTNVGKFHESKSIYSDDQLYK
jgi:hypothetical protein